MTTPQGLTPLTEDYPARAVIEDAHIVIRLPIANLQAAIDGGIATGSIPFEMRIADQAVFAKDVCAALNDEDEEGTTAIHKLFDNAFIDAAEQGSLGLKDEP